MRGSSDSSTATMILPHRSNGICSCVAELFHRLFARAAVDRLERAGAVVNARVHHAGVAAGLVPGDVGFFFEHGDALARVAFEEAVGGREADDAAADDDEVGFLHLMVSDAEGATRGWC